MSEDHRQPISFLAQIGAVNQRADGSISLRVSTCHEVADRDDRIKFQDYANTEVTLWLLPGDAQPEDANAIDSGAKKNQRKSPSQRMRGLLWRVWEARGGAGEFGDFYEAEIGRLMQGFRDELEEAKL